MGRGQGQLPASSSGASVRKGTRGELFQGDGLRWGPSLSPQPPSTHPPAFTELLVTATEIQASGHHGREASPGVGSLLL